MAKQTKTKECVLAEEQRWLTKKDRRVALETQPRQDSRKMRMVLRSLDSILPNKESTKVNRTASKP